MKKGSTDVSDIKKGSTDINKIYRGSDLVWERFSIDFPTSGLSSYWSFQITGTSTQYPDEPYTIYSSKWGSKTLFADSNYINSTGKRLNCILLGSKAYSRIKNPTPFSFIQIQNNFSINMWIYITDNIGGYILLNTINISNNLFKIILGGGGDEIYTYYLGEAGVIYGPKSSSLSLNTWYMLTYINVADNDYGELYINNTKQNSLAYSPYSTGPQIVGFSLGSIYNNNIWKFPFRGKIDEVGIWDRVLTSAEISDLYNSGNGTFY